MSGRTTVFGIGVLVSLVALVLLVSAPAGAAVYEVGPGKAYANINDVPIENLTAGDVMKIYHRSTPYREKFGVFGQGTSSNPITVQGIPGSGGELPVIDGENATTRPETLLKFWGENRSVIKVGGSLIPLSDGSNPPEYIVIENLHVKNGFYGKSFTDRAGQPQTYSDSAAACRVEYGHHITWRNMEFSHSGDGFQSSGVGSEDLTIEGCYYHDNGIAIADFGDANLSLGRHSNYTESKGILFQYNHFGPLKTGACGNTLKDRSSGAVIRYNWVDYGNTMLDLVDTEYSNIYNASDYGIDHVYGNVIIDRPFTVNEGYDNARIVHYGWDGAGADRQGPLRMYNNTIVSHRTVQIRVLRLQENETVDFFNNIVYRVYPGVTTYMNAYENGTTYCEHNVLPVNCGMGGMTLESPDSNAYNDSPGFADAANEDFHLTSGAAAIDIGDDVPGAWGHDVTLQYVKHRSYETRPSDATMDAGAFEYGTTGPLTVTTTSLPSGNVGEYYSQSLGATGGTVPYTWSIASGSLPSGLILIPATGQISGTATSSGTSNFTVQVTDSADPPASDTQSLSITMNTVTLEITTTNLPTGVVATDYNQTVSAVGGEGAYTWSIDSGTLPAGLSLSSSTGIISGTPTEADTDNFTVKVTDSATPTPNTDTQSLSIQILSAGNTYESTSSNTQSDTLSTTYINKAQLQFTPTHSDDWLIIASAELRGATPGASCRGQVTLDGTVIGSVFWRPKLNTDWSPMIVVYEAFLSASQHTINIDYATANASYQGSIRNARIAAVRRANLDFHSGVNDTSQALTASETTVASAGFTPSSQGRYLLITNLEFKGSDTTDITIKSRIGSTVLDDVSTKIRRPYDDNISYASFSVASLTAQQHTLSLTAQGSTAMSVRNCRVYAVRLSGGRFDSAVDATSDTESSTTSNAYQEKVTKTWTTGGTGDWLILTSARVNEADTGDVVQARVELDDTTTMNAVSRKPQNASDWHNVGGMDVQNLTNASHTIDIDYRTAGTGTAKIKYAHIAAIPLAFSEPSGTPTITTTSLADGGVNTFYSEMLSVSGGDPPYTWTVDSGSLPSGLSLNSSTGEISGTPTSSGTSSFTIKVTDDDSDTDTQALTITIYADLNITTTSLVDATKNVSYNETLAATGGLAPYTWSLDSGWLPIGLTLSSAGVINGGSPTSYGIFDFSVKCTDSQATVDTDTQALSITVHPETLNITTTSLPDGTVNAAYSQTVSATGGATPYTWSIDSGSLPTGLSLNSSTGDISGTPTGTGTSNFTVKVTDSWDSWLPPANTDTQALSITVNAEVLNITTTSLPDGTVNVSYSETVSASGGVTPYTWSIDSGSLPSGLSLNSSTGVVSGTPTSSGTSNFTIKVTDDESTTDTQALSIDVYADLTITTSSLPDGTAGTAYNQSVSASGGSTPYTWSIISGGPPAGITLNTSTGALSGTPTTVGTSNFTVKVTDSQPTPDEDTQALSITINAADLVITTTSLPDGILDTAYSQTVEASGGVEDYSWSIDSGSLPSGLSLNSSTGVISGTPDTIETANFTVKVTDSQTPTADTDTQALSIVIEPELLAITTTSLPDGTVSTSYSETVSATGGVTSYTWSIDSGSLPAGLSLGSSTGTISGTPTTSGLSEFTVKVTDSDTPASTDVQALSITIDPSAGAAQYEYEASLSESSTSSQSYQDKVTLQFTPDSTDDWIVIASADVNTTWTSAAIRARMTIDSTTYSEEDITPVITAETQWHPVFMMTKVNLDDSQHTVKLQYYSQKSNETVYIKNARVVAFPKDELAWHYEETGSSDSTLSTSWATKETLQFTPGSSGDYLVIFHCEFYNVSKGAAQIRAVNDTTTLAEVYESTKGDYPYHPFTYVDIINFGASQQTLKIDAKKASDYGAAAVRRCRILAIRLTGGRMSGAVEEASTGSSSTGSTSYQEKLTKSWSAGNTSYWLLLTTASVAHEENDEATDVRVQHDNTTILNNQVRTPWDYNDDSQYWSNNWLSIAGVGVIEDASGTEQVDVDYNTTKNNKDASIKDVHFVALPLGSAPPDPLIITTSSLPNAVKDASYSETVTATGGVTPYTWSIDSGSLPTGLSLNSSTGVISGTPTATGTSNFTVKVTDDASVTDTEALSISVYDDLSITTTTLPDGAVDSSYSQTVSASGGLTPYSWSIISGALPTGLTLNTSTGNISGTPTAYGTFNFTLEVADSQTTPDTDTQALSITVDPAPLNITTTSLADGDENSAYGQTLVAEGGVTPYAWSIDSGSLPAGLSLNATTGVISGTPTADGTSNFTVKVTDSDSPTASTDTQALSITIDPEPLHVTTTSLPSGQVSVSYSQTVQASGGDTPYSWSVYSGSLPAGLSLGSSTGTISGTPTAYGTSNFTVQVTDDNSDTDLQSLSIYIAPADVDITTTSLPDGKVGDSYSQTVQATGGLTPYTWSIDSGSLPAGLTLGSSTGTISGTPTAYGTSNFTVKVTDSQGTPDTDTQALSIDVDPDDVVITTTSLPDGTVDASYSQTVSATGGATPFMWSIDSGSLPSGLSLNSSTGEISGTPTTYGTSNFTVKVTDDWTPANTDTQALSIYVAPADLVITTTSLPNGAVDTAYSETVSATGGVTPYTWSIDSGTLPAGLSLNSSTGVISGTPTEADTDNFTVKVTDSQGTPDTDTQALSITVVASGPGYEYAASLSESSTSSQSWQNKLSKSFTPSTTDDWIIIATGDITTTWTSAYIRVRMEVDDTTESEVYFTPTDYSPKEWAPFFMMKKINLNTNQHTIDIDYYSERSNETVYIRNVRVVAFRKDQLTWQYGETGSSSSSLSTSWATKHSIQFTPSSTADYLVIYNAEFNNYSKGAAQLRAIDTSTTLVETHESTKGGTAWQSFAYVDIVSLDNTQHTLKIDAKKADDQGSSAVRRCRILAIRLDGGRMADAEEGASTGESNTTSTSWQQKLSKSWSAGTHENWLVLSTALVSTGSSNAYTVEWQMQHDDTTTANTQERENYDYNDNSDHYSNNRLQVAGTIMLESESGTQQVDLDYRVGSGSITVYIRDAHIVAIPLD
ncbi:MAG: putative Ig domain-containing protein [Planctomycetota bacterium]|jgi:hypothetical protein